MTSHRSSTRWVDVSVATVWTSPTSVRAVDASALGNPADPRAWVAQMSDAQKPDLVGRVQTQASYGTTVHLFGTSGSWSHIAVTTQPSQKSSLGYPGWVPSVQLTSTPPATLSTTAIVTSPSAWLYFSAATVGHTDGRVMELSYDTRLPVARETSSYVEVVMIGGTHRALSRDDVVLSTASPSRSRVIAEARRFLGLPYLWGGTSGFGYDCSGFTSSVYDVVGIKLSRDADQQALHGTAVSMNDLLPGDLLFVADSHGSIVHVAMYYGVANGVRSIVESLRTGTTVHIAPLSTHTYVSARRYLT